MSASDFFCFSPTSLATLVNVETIIAVPPTYLDDGRLSMLGSVERRMGNGRVRRDGSREGAVRFGKLSRVEYRDFLLAAFGGYTVSSAQIYFTWYDDLGYLTPFYGWIDRPRKYRDFTPVTLLDVIFPLHDYVALSVTKDDDYTMTSADRWLRVDTTDDDTEITLPDADAVEADTIVSVSKETAANTLTIAAASGDTVEGSTSISLSERGGRYDLASDGVSAWTAVDG